MRATIKRNYARTGIWDNKENTKGFAFPGSVEWSHKASM